MRDRHRSDIDFFNNPETFALDSSRELLDRPTQRRRSSDRQTIWKGMIAGLAGGLAGSWAMNQFQSRLPALSPPQSTPQRGDDATVKAASAILERVAHHPLTTDEKAIAGPVMHYAFGSAAGAVYGGVAEALPSSAGGWGLPFGALLWLGADEMAVPVLGLSRGPTEVSASVHASALMSHLVYGVTADAVRRAVRAAL